MLAREGERHGKSCGDLGTGHRHICSPTSCKHPACGLHVRCSYRSQGRLGKEGSFLFRKHAARVPTPTQPTQMARLTLCHSQPISFRGFPKHPSMFFLHTCTQVTMFSAIYFFTFFSENWNLRARARFSTCCTPRYNTVPGGALFRLCI